MKFYNICTKRTYESQGVTKTQWLNCGKMKELDGGKRFIELAMFPNTSFYVFEAKPKEENNNAPKDW